MVGGGLPVGKHKGFGGGVRPLCVIGYLKAADNSVTGAICVVDKEGAAGCIVRCEGKAKQPLLPLLPTRSRMSRKGASHHSAINNQANAPCLLKDKEAAAAVAGVGEEIGLKQALGNCGQAQRRSGGIKGGRAGRIASGGCIASSGRRNAGLRCGCDALRDHCACIGWARGFRSSDALHRSRRRTRQLRVAPTARDWWVRHMRP